MTNPSPSNAELVNQTKQGEKKSFEQLIDRILPVVFGFFYYLNAPEDIVEDLVWETFTKAYQNLASFDSDRPFLTWVVSIGRNVYNDHCRKVSREKRLKIEVSKQKPIFTEEKILDKMLVKDLLDSLPIEDKFLVELRIFQDLPFSEISKIVNEPEGNLRVQFHRTIARLRLASGKENENAK
ncbi:MAG: sigma-70 family RNA polymerase sigma factor [Candidatus Riflebacteria bacterium]|nr:sigma-70 family RNA polymerase sigma factor [Candidatus Riflebacteria bacterium]